MPSRVDWALRDEVFALRVALVAIRNCVDAKCWLCGPCLTALAVLDEPDSRVYPVIADDDPVRVFRDPKPPTAPPARSA